MYKGADRPNIMKRFFAERSPVLGDTNELESVFDGETCVQHLIVSLFNRQFAKDSFADDFRSSNGKQLWVDKLSYIVTHSDRTEGGREGLSSACGVTMETLYMPRGCVGSWVKSRRIVSSPPTMKRSWEMGWRPFSGSSTSYPTSGRNCQPIPTNSQSHVPEVRQGEHDLSHDGPQ